MRKLRRRKVGFCQCPPELVFLNPVILGLKATHGVDEKVNLAELVGNTEDFAESGCVPPGVLNWPEVNSSAQG